MRSNAFIFLLTLVHNERNMFFKVKFGVIPDTKQCFFCAGFDRGSSKNDLVGVFELNKRWHFFRLAFHMVIFETSKSLSDVDWNLDITVSV